jgi:hypothetical protein
MSHAHRALALLAALVWPCAQGCRVGASAPPAARSMQESPAPSAAPAPTPHVAPLPADERGTDAFEPYVNLSGGRAIESREVDQKPVRKDLKVTANYPALVGDDRPAAREFNRRTRTFVLGGVSPYLYDTGDTEKAKDPHWKDVEEFYDVSHKVVYASDEFVSVLFYIVNYNWGAAHSIHQPVSFNFDLKTGREVKLAQLFRPGSAYLRHIAALCEKDLTRRFRRGFPEGQSIISPDGVTPKPGNFDSWVVTRDGLVFIFEEYQVVSYADGEPKVLIPFDSLKEFINPRGALARLAAHQ